MNDHREPPPPVWSMPPPCDCRHCSVCGYWGMAPKPQPPPKEPRDFADTILVSPRAEPDGGPVCRVEVRRRGIRWFFARDDREVPDDRLPTHWRMPPCSA